MIIAYSVKVTTDSIFDAPEYNTFKTIKELNAWLDRFAESLLTCRTIKRTCVFYEIHAQVDGGYREIEYESGCYGI